MDSLRLPAFPGSVHVPDSSDVAHFFGPTTFNKGAWVLHRLRHALGGRTFFAALQDYVRSYACGSVTTARFQRVCERHAGQGLDWFFREWVYGTGRPAYRLAWAALPDRSHHRAGLRRPGVRDAARSSDRAAGGRHDRRGVGQPAAAAMGTPPR